MSQLPSERIYAIGEGIMSDPETVEEALATGVKAILVYLDEEYKRKQYTDLPR